MIHAPVASEMTISVVSMLMKRGDPAGPESRMAAPTKKVHTVRKPALTTVSPARRIQ